MNFGLRDYWLRYPDIAIPSPLTLAKLQSFRASLESQMDAEAYWLDWNNTHAKQIRLTNYAIDNVIRRLSHVSK